MRRTDGLPHDQEIERHFHAATQALWTLYGAEKNGDTGAANKAADGAARATYATDDALNAAAAEYRAQARTTLSKARAATVALILALFTAFATFYIRAVRRRRQAEELAAENQRLLKTSREEAVTDALTGLGNRRALIRALDAASSTASRGQLLALFDLDGFKQYNDNFGHPAGDALLARLGERLKTTMAGLGAAYRMGGDEFCVLAPAADEGSDLIPLLAASALNEDGEGFRIGCSYGVARIPTDTTNPVEALRLADQRMYDHKRSGRVSPGRQSANVLLQLLAERSSELGQHTADVAFLAEQTAAALGISEDGRARIRLAAELHDTGNAAIPDTILNKPGPLSDDEWEFVRRHTIIGERIVSAAPSLAAAAALVRSHHERYDGNGYPDGLARDAIPFGARIIAVSDAYDAMTTHRPYHEPVSSDDAVAELIRNAGTQFDAAVVGAFVQVLAQQAAPRRGFKPPSAHLTSTREEPSFE